MFSILRNASSARRSPRRARPSRRPPRLRPVLWLESLEDRTLLSGGPVGSGLAVPASPLDPSVPGLFGRQNPQPASRNAAVVNLTAQNAAVGTTGVTGANRVSTVVLNSLGDNLPSTLFPAVSPTTTGTVAVTFNPLTGQPLAPGTPAANSLRTVLNASQLTALEPAPQVAAQLGTTALPVPQATLTEWAFQQHNLVLLTGGGGSNAMLGPNTLDNPRAPRPAPQPNGEQEEPAPMGVNGDNSPDTGEPVEQPAPPSQPGAGPASRTPAPVTDGDEQAVLLAEPSTAEKLPGGAIVQEKPAEIVPPVEQAPAPAAAPATPAPLWLRVLSAVSFAAGAVGAVWVPKFGARGMSREDLLTLRRDTPRPRPVR